MNAYERYRITQEPFMIMEDSCNVSTGFVSNMLSKFTQSNKGIYCTKCFYCYLESRSKVEFPRTHQIHLHLSLWIKLWILWREQSCINWGRFGLLANGASEDKTLNSGFDTRKGKMLTDGIIHAANTRVYQ
jgi:hypothetical protein